MATAIDICNSALLKLGAEPVVSITAPIDNTKRAKLCAAHYERVKDQFLGSEEPVWFFAVKAETLTGTLLADTITGFTYEFDLPADYVKTYKVGNYDDFEYQRYGDKLLANDEELPLFYVYDVVEADFPSYFSECLEWKFAMELSYSMIQSNETEQRIKADYKDAMKLAKLANLREASRGDLPLVEFTGARL